ncbi:MAG: PheT, partial [Chloroflexi bacterium]|nr:PheT [Chloroflexota bacterium]
MSGSLVERVVNSGSEFDDILVARVVALDHHPNADSLWLATLDLGDRTQTVVTGAQNLYVGALVPFIGIGKCLPGQDRPLEGKMLRGIRSEGMVCSG